MNGLHVSLRSGPLCASRARPLAALPRPAGLETHRVLPALIGTHGPAPLPVTLSRSEPDACRRASSKHRLRIVPQAGFSPFLLSTTAPVWQDIVCFLVAGLAARAWTKIFDLLVTNGVLEKKLSRKLVHITTGPIFLLTWPFFSVNPWARVMACCVPAINAVRLLSVGLGFSEDKGLVASVSRSGDRGELLKGPLYYTMVLLATTLFCWRDDPTGMLVICLMCGGDGFADIIGRRFGKGNQLPYNTSKSWAGSMAMLIGGTIMAAGLIGLFCTMGYFECYSVPVLLPYLLAVSGAATIVESLPINQIIDDNLSVPVVSAIMAMLIMPHAATAAAGVALPAL